MIGEVGVYAHDFVDVDGSAAPFWRDVGTLEAYYETNLDLCNVQPQFNLYDYDWPIYTLWHNDPPAKTVLDDPNGRRAEVLASLLAPGVFVSGGLVRRSILSNRALVTDGAQLDECIVFSGVQVGKGAQLRRCIVDKWVEIPAGARIGFDADEDREHYTVSSTGITVVPRVDRYHD
jgi:glucose-1-phosphate adenylyltransferase